MALDFIYSQPVKIYFGAGTFAKLGEILSELRRPVSPARRRRTP